MGGSRSLSVVGTSECSINVLQSRADPALGLCKALRSLFGVCADLMDL